MELVPTPKQLNYTKIGNNKGRFLIDPLYPGYGITIGNALRRVLLSSIPGAAITTVKIKGVEHEFSTLAHIKEDMVDVILNIKQIRLRIEPGIEISETEPLILKISKKGEGKATAGDLECPSQVKVVNENQLIATLTDSAAEFEAEFTVGIGQGYVPVENFKGEKLSIGHIAVDAIFTPIYQVEMKTEHVRVGEMTNWDKLSLTIATDGSLTPEEAYQKAVDILYEQIKWLKEERGGDIEGEAAAADKVEEKRDEGEEEKEKKEKKRKAKKEN